MLEAPREVNQPQAIGERLLTSRPERDAGMGAHRLEQHRDRLGDRAVIAPDMELRQQSQCVGDLDAQSHQVPSGRPHAWDAGDGLCSSPFGIHILPEGEKSIVAESEERPPQSGKDPEFVIGPFDGRESIAQRDDFLAIVERTATDQHMGNAPRLKSTDIGPGYVASRSCGIGERGCRYGAA